MYVCSFYPTQANKHRGGFPAIRPPHVLGPLDQRCHSLQYKCLTCVLALLRLSALSSGLLRNFLCCCWVSHWVTSTGGRPTSQPADLSGQPVLSPSVWWFCWLGEHLDIAIGSQKTFEISWIEDESCDSWQWYSCFSWNDIVSDLDENLAMPI